LVGFLESAWAERFAVISSKEKNRCVSARRQVVPRPESLSTELDQETVLMSIDAGSILRSGGTCPEYLGDSGDPLDLFGPRGRLVEEYQVSPETCAADWRGFLEEMEREGLLRVE
jgi:hypothetical protein